MPQDLGKIIEDFTDSQQPEYGGIQEALDLVSEGLDELEGDDDALNTAIESLEGLIAYAESLKTQESE